MFNEAIKQGGIAVITGAASGVGFAAAEALAGRGLDLVLIDLPGPALDEAASKLSNSGASVTAIGTDVSDAEAMMALADQANQYIETQKPWSLAKEDASKVLRLGVS